MPLNDTFQLPATPEDLLPLLDNTSPTTLFLLFLAPNDPVTRQPWCSDVRAALPVLNTVFSADASPVVHIVFVGQRAEWKEPDNVYRKVWGVKSIPALIRYEKVAKRVEEAGRLVEGELLDKGKIGAIVG
ncbi:hypothetical protein NX059_007676 [Plenodomus lindquistii]|nr:hypothetical protein NX059_007676 [Plenodomus lindquistii]